LWRQFISWVTDNKIGDLASIAGVLISVVGFAVTIVGVARSQGAAKRAEQAAKETRDKIRLLDTVVDFSAAISILEEVKRMHRSSEWALLPERYATIRKHLITLRTNGPRLTDEQNVTIQTALANLREMEAQVERARENQTMPKSAKFNMLISTDIDNLITVLNELKAARTGG
jgi:hypothetical protein